MKNSLREGVLICAFFFAPMISLFAQGSLTPPPGAPAPTMKALDQIEPRIPISSLPFTINASGSYYLTGNLQFTAISGNAITINVSNVTLDLMGFTLSSTASVTGSAIQGNSGLRNVAVKNGVVSGTTTVTITGFPNQTWNVVPGGFSTGIGCGGMISCQFSHLRISGCRQDALDAGDHSVVEQVTTTQNGFSGINTFRGTVTNSTTTVNGGTGMSGYSITNCVSDSNGGAGIIASLGSVTNSSVSFNGDDGISAAYGTVTNCLVRANGRDGISSGGPFPIVVAECTATINIMNGINAGPGSAIKDCSAQGNSGDSGILTGDDSTLSHCTANGNVGSGVISFGIQTGINCVVLDCTASSNSTSNGTPTNTTGGGILAGQRTSVMRCNAGTNQGDGIKASIRCLIKDNSCELNGSGGDGAGIHTTGGDNRLEANNVAGNDRGIDVDASGSLIIKNSASGNTTNYVIAASNRYGPIIDITAAGAAAVNGNNAADTTTTTHPWANFSY